ncbi:MAG: hypothetical protein WD470_09365 [Rhodospirillaceae bacterium]
MAKKKDAKDRGKPGSAARRKGPGRATVLIVVLCVFGFFIAALPSVIVLCVGMVPTIVACIIDLTPGRYAARCVAGVNLAGVVPFLDRLWSSTNDLAAAIGIVSDVYAWLIFYAASGVGWLLFMGLPGLVASYKTFSARRRANSLRGRLEELKREWGSEVSGNATDDLTGDGLDKISAETAVAEQKAAPA